MTRQALVVLTTESYFISFLQEQIKAGGELVREIAKLKTAFNYTFKSECDKRWKKLDNKNIFFLRNAFSVEDNIFLRKYDPAYGIQKQVKDSAPGEFKVKNRNNAVVHHQKPKSQVDGFITLVTKQTQKLSELLQESSGLVFAEIDDLDIRNKIKFMLWRNYLKEPITILRNLAISKENKSLYLEILKLRKRSVDLQLSLKDKINTAQFPSAADFDERNEAFDKVDTEDNILEEVWKTIHKASQIGLFDESNVKRYPVFISYHTDESHLFVNKLLENLQDYNVKTWVDSEKILPGDIIRKEIYEGIRAYDKAIVVYTKNYLMRPFVQEELTYILNKQHKYQVENRTLEGLIIPITLNSTIPDLPMAEFELLVKLKVLDFSEWQNEEKFQETFMQLLTALRVDRKNKKVESHLD